MVMNMDYCCDVMRNAVVLGALQVHDGVPECRDGEDEATNDHFPFRCCPFCGHAYSVGVGD